MEKNNENSTIVPISGNIICFYIINKTSYEIKSYSYLRTSIISEKKSFLHSLLNKFIKINNSNEKCYQFKTIYLSSIIIQAISTEYNNNNIFMRI